MSFTSRLSSSPAQHECEWLSSSSPLPGRPIRKADKDGSDRSLQGARFPSRVLSDVASEDGENASDRSASVGLPDSPWAPNPHPASAANAHNQGVPSGLARAARGLLLGHDTRTQNSAASSPRPIGPRFRRRTTYGSVSNHHARAALSHSFDVEPSQLRAAASADAPVNIFHARDLDPILSSPARSLPTQEDVDQTLLGLSRDVSQSGLARASGFTPTDIARWKRSAQSKKPYLSAKGKGRIAPEVGESSPLLEPSDHTATGDEEAQQFTDTSAWGEAKTLVRYSLPITGTHLLEMSLSTTVFSLGHLGTVELAAASLASLTGNVTGFSIISGFVSALDSLLPAAYASDRPWTVGLWTQRMAVLLAALLLPIALIWFYSEPLLLAMKQEPEVARLAAQYLRVLIAALPAYAGFETCRRYLQAQKLFVAPTIAVGIAGAINVPLNVLLVYGPHGIGMGFIGAPIASLVAYYVMFGLALVQCSLAPRETWAGLTKAALNTSGLKSLWNLGFASTAAMAAEWWAWEITGLLTSYLGTTWLAAQSVLLVTSALTFQMPYALATATAVRVGNLLGAYAAKPAYISARAAIIIALVAGSMNSLFLIGARNYWGLLFTSDRKVLQIIAQNLPFLAAFQVADAVIAVTGGILRSSGRQSVGAYLNLLSYYVLGIPTSMYLMHLGWKLSGIWLGLTLGIFVGAVTSTMVVLRTNWEREAHKAQERVSAAACAESEEDLATEAEGPSNGESTPEAAS